MQALRLFREVARYHSFSRAAATLGMTQSAVSQRIVQLEKRLGITLIDRSVRPLALTEAGRIYQEGCCDILNRQDALERRIVRLQSKVAGEVRVDAIYSAGIDLLNRIRAEFCQQFPSVRVRVEYKRPNEVHDAVRAGTCDLGIVSFPQRWRDVSTTALRDEEMVVVCEPEHPLANEVSIPVTALHDVHMVAFDADLPIARKMRQYFRDHRVRPVIVNEFDNVDTMKTAVSLAHQVALLPDRTVRHEVEMGTLRALALTPPLVRPLGIIRPKRVALDGLGNTAVRTFLDFLQQHAGVEEGIKVPLEHGAADHAKRVEAPTTGKVGA